MATIKSFTSLEQSKKLSKFLPFESADMLWEQHGAEPYVTIKPWTTIGKSIGCHCLRCWSLTALLSVLPLPSLIQDKADNELFWKCSAYNEDGTLLCEIYDNNPVDACYEMILKLHELNLL